MDRSSSSPIAFKTGSEVATAVAVRGACVAVRTALSWPASPREINAEETMNHAENHAAVLEFLGERLFFDPGFIPGLIPRCLQMAVGESASVPMTSPFSELQFVSSGCSARLWRR